MTGRIDSHQHFIRYSAAEYAWIDDAMAALRRDFLPADLAPLLAAAGIDGSIAVQARQTLQETRWLLQLAAGHPSILGVVGWVDLCAGDVARQLDALATPVLRGVRHVLQAEPADFALRADFQRGIGQLAGRGLVYDVLVFAPQLPAAVALCRAFPQQTFVLDHLGKPDVRRGRLQVWASDLRALAALPNVCCKLSGLATEADWSTWTAAMLQPYFATALDAFGPRRLLFGSDWPVCLCATDYRRWFETVLGWLQPLTDGERAAVLGGNAARVYLGAVAIS